MELSAARPWRAPNRVQPRDRGQGRWSGGEAFARAAPLQTVRQITSTKLHQRLALQGADDEHTALADTFDDLLARLEMDGLSLGTDDYLTKQLHFSELVQRLRALARANPAPVLESAEQPASRSTRNSAQ